MHTILSIYIYEIIINQQKQISQVCIATGTLNAVLRDICYGRLSTSGIVHISVRYTGTCNGRIRVVIVHFLVASELGLQKGLTILMYQSSELLCTSLSQKVKPV